MKIRTGFVSNSSSSSFCIAGYSFKNKKDIKEAMLKLFSQLGKMSDKDKKRGCRHPQTEGNFCPECGKST
ncbi:MAG: hypothetical protein AABY32_04305 [Nanoarchaeota archaeon]